MNKNIIKFFSKNPLKKFSKTDTIKLDYLYGLAIVVFISALIIRFYDIFEIILQKLPLLTITVSILTFVGIAFYFYSLRYHQKAIEKILLVHSQGELQQFKTEFFKNFSIPLIFYPKNNSFEQQANYFFSFTQNLYNRLKIIIIFLGLLTMVGTVLELISYTNLFIQKESPIIDAGQTKYILFLPFYCLFLTTSSVIILFLLSIRIKAFIIEIYQDVVFYLENKCDMRKAEYLNQNFVKKNFLYPQNLFVNFSDSNFKGLSIMTNDTDSNNSDSTENNQFTLPKYDYGFFYKKLFEINDNINKVKKQMLFASNDNLVIERFTKIIEEKLVPQFDIIHSKIASLEAKFQETLKNISIAEKNLTSSITEKTINNPDNKQGICHKTVLEASQNLVIKEEFDKDIDNNATAKNNKTAKTNLPVNDPDFDKFIKQVNDKATPQAQTKPLEPTQKNIASKTEEKTLDAPKKARNKPQGTTLGTGAIATGTETKKQTNPFETLRSKIQEEFNVSEEHIHQTSNAVTDTPSRSAILRKNQEILSKKLQELNNKSTVNAQNAKQKSFLAEDSEESFITPVEVSAKDNQSKVQIDFVQADQKTLENQERILLKDNQKRIIPDFSLPTQIIHDNEESFIDDDLNTHYKNQRESLAELQKILKENNSDNGTPKEK